MLVTKNCCDEFLWHFCFLAQNLWSKLLCCRCEFVEKVFGDNQKVLSRSNVRKFKKLNNPSWLDYIFQQARSMIYRVLHSSVIHWPFPVGTVSALCFYSHSVKCFLVGTGPIENYVFLKYVNLIQRGWKWN